MPKLSLGQSNGNALVAQWIEHLTTDQKVGGSSPFERASGPARCVPPVGALLYPPIPTSAYRSGPHPPRHTLLSPQHYSFTVIEHRFHRFLFPRCHPQSPGALHDNLPLYIRTAITTIRRKPLIRSACAFILICVAVNS